MNPALYGILATGRRRNRRLAKFQTCLTRLNRNLCIDHYRSVRKERGIVDWGGDAAEISPVSHGPNVLVTLERSDLLRHTLVALPDTLLSAVVLRDIQELSYQEIATTLAPPDDTLKSRINSLASHQTPDIYRRPTLPTGAAGRQVRF
jgi:RNA polymerase sigma-70 factor (ECF subfamily)